MGACVRRDLLAADGGRECCAVCKRHFRDYRAWSVHAFSAHARTDESRRLVNGTQCPICLKHFTSGVKLSRHVRYSSVCRRQLLSTRERYTPEPGVGSRCAPDDSLLLLPALHAEGPRPCPVHLDVESEEERPSAELVDCLAHLDFDGRLVRLPEEDFWARVRASFSCVCLLQLARLRITATVGRTHLQPIDRTCPWMLGPDGPYRLAGP